VLIAAAAVLPALIAPAIVDAAPGRSTTIALTSDETRVVVVNREANSLSVIRVKNANGNDVKNKLAEVAVGEEPRCVAVSPDDRFAFVTNAISASVSVVSLVQNRVVKTISVGTEPRGCALTADGSLLYVANHTEGTVSIVDTSSRTVAGTVQVGGRPFAVAITDTGSIATDTVFVTDAFAELNPDFVDPNFDGNGEARDLGKQGVVHAFPAGNASPPITKITLKPLADSGFTANLVAPNNFCGPAAHSLIIARTRMIRTTLSTWLPRRGCFQPTPVGADSRQSSVFAQYRLPASASRVLQYQRAGARLQCRCQCLAGGTHRACQSEPADCRGDGAAAT
jgi:YVTN family beta-propeller protein